jgi:hypothetical protein
MRLCGGLSPLIPIQERFENGARHQHEIIPCGGLLSCPICNLRKEKRFCPAIHGRICAQCCGEQREVTLDCPGDCPYLQQAREHEKPRDISQLDREALFPQVELSQQFVYEHEHLILGLSFALAKSVQANRGLVDRDLLSALAALAKSYETLANSSLIYEEASANLVHQALGAEVRQMVKEFREEEHKHLGHTRLRDADILKTLVFLLRMGTGRTSGRPKSRAFIDFLRAQFPEKQSAIAKPEEASRIIVP